MASLCLDRAPDDNDNDRAPVPSSEADGAVMSDFVHGSVWQEHMGENSGPANRIIGLSLAMDGFNPFHGKHTPGKYLLPLKVSCLNLSPTIRNELPAQYFPAVLEGNAEPDPVFALEVFADEVMYGEHIGFDIDADASNEEVEPFVCHVKLLQLRGDYRGLQKILRRAGSPAIVGACWKCHVQGQHDKGMKKTIYPGKVP